MLSSIIVEVYGYKNARQAIWSGLILNLSFVLFINLVNIIPSSPHWHLETQFHDILVPENRIIFASLVSFLLSDFLNSYFMAKMKLKDKGKSLIKRILVSSGLSLSIDINCFMLLAFLGAMPSSILFKLILAAYIKKFACQILLFPAIVYMINMLKTHENIDVYDYDTKFNPFSIDNVYEMQSLKRNQVSNNIINLKPSIVNLT